MSDLPSFGKSLIRFEVLGEPASKANSRRLVNIKGRIIPIKSQKALDYVKGFQAQCPKLAPLIEGPVHVNIEIWYASMRPDLDESVVLDAMQGLIYVNDRQVWSKYVVRRIDPTQPRIVADVQDVAGLFEPVLHRRHRPEKKDSG